MPTILRKNGFRYYFYSNEHTPIHVHVSNGSGVAKFNVLEEVVLVESEGMKVKELAEAQQYAEENVELIRREWHEYFG